MFKDKNSKHILPKPKKCCHSWYHYEHSSKGLNPKEIPCLFGSLSLIALVQMDIKMSSLELKQIEPFINISARIWPLMGLKFIIIVCDYVTLWWYSLPSCKVNKSMYVSLLVELLRKMECEGHHAHFSLVHLNVRCSKRHNHLKRSRLRKGCLGSI